MLIYVKTIQNFKIQMGNVIVTIILRHQKEGAFINWELKDYRKHAIKVIRNN